MFGVFSNDSFRKLFLAQVVKSNVRELEGTLLRLAVKAELANQAIDLDFAKEALRGVMPRAEVATSVEDIQRAVCEYYSIRLAELKSHRRHRAIVDGAEAEKVASFAQELIDLGRRHLWHGKRST